MAIIQFQLSMPLWTAMYVVIRSATGSVASLGKSFSEQECYTRGLHFAYDICNPIYLLTERSY